MIECPPAFGAVTASGVIRHCPEDFRVDERLGFEPGDGGEHLWLHVEKRGWNTVDVASWLAGCCGVPLRAVGYSGLKDRHAVTRQWFSVHLPGKDDPVIEAIPEGLVVLQQMRHRRKLNRGTHRSNHFSLRVRALAGDLDSLEGRLENVRAHGVPNYFGMQRFGRESKNVSRGRDWLLGDGEAPRKQASKSMWLSALRSDLFNQVLAERVRLDCWSRLLDGDILQPEGSRGLFLADSDDTASARVAAGDVHPTAPMPGEGGMTPTGACAELEERVLAPHHDLIAALAAQRVDGMRRATRLPVAGMRWQLDTAAAQLTLDFALPSGAFATAVLAELLAVEDGSRPAVHASADRQQAPAGAGP